jgi:hypothetical protein
VIVRPYIMQIVRSLLVRPRFYCYAVGINAENSEGLRALDFLHG